MKSPSVPNGARVLVCVDERHIVRLIQVNLERHGCKVTCAYSGAEALRILQAELFDLVILDPDMTPISGADVRHWLIAQHEAYAEKIVMLDRDPTPISWPWSR